MLSDDLSAVVVSKGPCDECGSSDNLVTYADGHEFCYSPGCGLRKGPDNMEDAEPFKPSQKETSAIPFTEEHQTNGLRSRGLERETLRKAGYFVHQEGDKFLQVANYYSQNGNLSHQKFRSKDKKFWFTDVAGLGVRTKHLQLYLQHYWGEKHDKRLIITEGELDALSVAQATNWKVPVVSLVQGIANAVECLKANYRWIDRYDEIILWFDNDEPGQSVIAECASLFPPGRVKTITVEGVKDASEMLQANRPGDITAAIYGAVTWAPSGIINAADCGADMDQDEAEVICKYPWPKLQEMTSGILESEVVYHVGGTGIGKTSIIVEIQNKLLASGVKFGVMRFEDTRRKAQLDLMSRSVSRRLHLEPMDSETRRKLHSTVFGSGLVELLDPETADWSFDSIMGYARYMMKALDCRVVFIDPLSFLVAASQERDERKALDNVAYQLARHVKQNRGNFQICHHLSRGEGKAHEEGGEISLKHIRGSGGVANFSMAVFGYERNQQGERSDLSRIRVLKNRFTGTTGLADTIKWDDFAGTLTATDEPYPSDDNEGGDFGPPPTANQEY
jgi:twinkle protein